MSVNTASKKTENVYILIYKITTVTKKIEKPSEIYISKIAQ